MHSAGTVTVSRRTNSDRSITYTLRWRDDQGQHTQRVLRTEPKVTMQRLRAHWEKLIADRRYEKEQELINKRNSGGDSVAARLPDAGGLYLDWAESHRAPKTHERIGRTIPDFCAFMTRTYRIDLATEVQPNHVRAYREMILDRGLVTSTANTETRTLSGFFKWLLDKGWVTINPAHISPLETSVTRADLRVANHRDFWGLLSELYHHCLAGEDHDLWYVAGVGLLGTTGMRRGELTNLRFYDWHDDTLTIRPMGRESTKKHARKIPLSKYAIIFLRVLEDWRKRWRKDYIESYVISARTRPDKPLSTQLNWALRAVDLVPHDLRRFYITAMETIATPPYILDDLVGHTTPAIRGAYSNANNLEMMRPWVTKFDDWLAQGLELAPSPLRRLIASQGTGQLLA
jgi:integrase